MSWRDIIAATPRPPSQYSHNPQNPVPGSDSEDYENTEDRASEYSTASTRVAELREQARVASTWDDLDVVTKEAQTAYDTGEVTCEEVESLTGYVRERSRQIPEHAEEGRLSGLLARQPVVRVRSRLLGEIVVWLAEGAKAPEDTSEVAYRETELCRMPGWTSAKVRAVHETKRCIEGELIE